MKNMFSKGAHPSEFGHRQTTMLMLGLFLLVSQCLFAQSRIIKGTVYDEHKDALIGASVILKGTSQGTITDIDGNFSVEASDNNTVGCHLKCQVFGFCPWKCEGCGAIIERENCWS